MFNKVIDALLNSKDCKSASYYVSPKKVVKATFRHKPRKGNRYQEMVVTVGCPNYLGRLFVKKCMQAGEPFPVKRVQLRPYPKKKRK